MDAAKEKMLDEMLDRHAIYQVLLRYARGLDRFDRALVRSCYFDDAIEDHFNFVGHIEDFIDWANETSGHFVSCQHGLMNHSCDLVGNDAYCETYYLFSGVSAAPAHFISTGRYVDHFQKRNGEWRIANRVTIIEGQFDIPDSPAARSYPSPFKPHEFQPAGRDRNDVSYQRPPRPRKPSKARA